MKSIYLDRIVPKRMHHINSQWTSVPWGILDMQKLKVDNGIGQWILLTNNTTLYFLKPSNCAWERYDLDMVLNIFKSLLVFAMRRRFARGAIVPRVWIVLGIIYPVRVNIVVIAYRRSKISYSSIVFFSFSYFSLLICENLTVLHDPVIRMFIAFSLFWKSRCSPCHQSWSSG